MQKRKPIIIDLPAPSMGGNAWLLDDKGMFVLQSGPGALRTIACTHAGSGSLIAFDGVPNEDGYFPDEQMMEPELPKFPPEATDAEKINGMNDYLEAQKKYHARNGRPIYRANPVVMGSWMCDAGFLHGLTIIALGGTTSASAIATIVWMPVMERAKKPDVKSQ